jgi:hypothetical protein
MNTQRNVGYSSQGSRLSEGFAELPPCAVYINSKYQVVPGKKWAPVQMILCVKVRSFAAFAAANVTHRLFARKGKQRKEDQ